MISKAVRTIEKYNMLEGVQKLVVGFSGGADSTALLHFLYFFVSDCGKKFNIEAVHINHGIRGDEALRDEAFTKLFCKKYGIKITVVRVDIKKIARESKIGIEEAGRNIRYKIFNELCVNKNCKIVTAHTLSDCCETLILNLTRGTSLKGLCGIPACRDNIIRPLISITRNEIEKYCSENKLEYVDDSSNFTTDYTRNKIRLEVIPFLKKINPNFESSVFRTLTNVVEDEEYLDGEAQKIFRDSKISQGYDISQIACLPECLKKRVIVKILKEATHKYVEQKHVDLLAISLLDNRNIALPGDLIACFKDNILKIYRKNAKHEVKWQYKLQKCNILTEIKINIIIRVVPFLEYTKLYSELDKKNVLDFEKIPENCVIRNRRAGDVFTFDSRNITKSVKKIMNEFKIPIDLRNNVPMIACNNEILWMDNIGVSKKYVPDKNTKRIAIIYKEYII